MDNHFKHQPLKKYGQNFLNDQNILNKIASITNIKNKNIVEIGPGQGNLTKILLKDAKIVNAFEIDINLYNYLNEIFVTNKNLILHNIDFLKFNLNDLGLDKFIVVANIPYNITTDIVFKLFDSYKKIDEIVLLVQKEFAQRMCAKYGQKDYGKLSITTSIFYKANLMFDVSPKAFSPSPKVVSSVIYLNKNEKLDVSESEINEFMEFIKNCFSMKRKTLVNNLKKLNIPTNAIYEIFMQSNINKNARPEQVSLDNYVFLFEKIKNFL